MTTLPFMPPCSVPMRELMLARPGTINRILYMCLREWNAFGQQVVVGDRIIKAGKQEHARGFYQKVGVYWRTGTGRGYDGRDRDQAWSATFISYVMRMAGISDEDFDRSIRHSEYIHMALQNRVSGARDAAFVGRRLIEYRPKPGDLVAYSRTSRPMTFDRAVDRERYKSHTDIVVYTRQGEIGVIGGNVEQSVSLKRVSTDRSGHVDGVHKDWFAVLENRLPQS